MSPEQKASKLFEVGEQLDRVCNLLTVGTLATEAITDQSVGMALYALLSEVSAKVAQQAEAVRHAR